MPIIKSAIKKLRKDKVRTVKNKVKKETLKALIKKVRVNKTPENLSAVFSALDKAAKTNLIHKNKAARLKSRLSKGVIQTSSAIGGSVSGRKKSAQKKKPVKKLAKTSKK
ncbi:30S ribosomal protein S20 [Candidatus Daviesbacteria bacterium RIFCSPHIGHO2_12_FULL_37_11]|uniref:Small ribosomal subunit protein bS20 n=1 Tax=Candidatus Daviesbacteria bacterium RIFCSPHIGHO2_12_FULL_37_11 TaxID=1797777 RepID=A0A1F5KD55_9BACT|nr:MAG: 30S ribosomal protein S20 [Candidatus Daviesbacteria bacterium GWA1_38_6]OGE17998.1 MAG: 30S ribosomal protein S20 [Candidatus Daviesbacteria bacterium RIFCSPHIGHO2_01_FULL_37_27]OGE38730.1 MAG: 30S ribosomal protein S20 [Candidatus Daviesbacteria bacterium RIFCSPHIGHO2_12_FULL_37_11]OGE45819.1 MAG: 30S ribosomal protein S20 [Candidatus Daviesbacteria bacterium RIFCSPLOWO2_01_FULL_37_10]